MRTENIEVKAFTIFDAPTLDPITVVMRDIAPGKGQLIIECYGLAWSAYWGAIGDRKVKDFVLGCSAEYIVNRMVRPREIKQEQAYLLRIVRAVIESLAAQESEEAN